MFDQLQSQVHDAVTLPLLRRNGADDNTLPFLPSQHRMTWTPSATRSDVVRMIRRYKEREFSIPSAAGKIAIDETRVVKRGRRGAEVDVMDASWAEIIDSARNWQIRQAVTAPVARRTDVKGSAEWNRDHILRCVAPRRSVAPIVKVKSSRRGGLSEADADVRAWRDTVTNKLARIPRVEASALLEAEELRLKLIETSNRLTAARSDLRRATGGRRRAPDADLHVIVVALFISEERDHLSRLRAIVHSTEYDSGIDHLLEVCTVSRDVEEYCFRMREAA